MSAPRYLECVSLTTGWTWRHPLTRPTSDAIDIMAQPLRSEPDTPLPLTVYDVSADIHGPCLRLTVRHWEALGGDRFLTLGAASHSRCGAGLWRALHDEQLHRRFATRGDPAPAAPWLAIRLEAGADDIHPARLDWLADRATDLVAAWLELRGAGGDAADTATEDADR